MATDGGEPAVGKSLETKFCNEKVACSASKDCLFDDWSEWGGCSSTCFGVKKRTRRIKQYGRGSGKWCMGALKEIWPCNPAFNKAVPAACKPQKNVDCVMTEWQKWEDCSATCGGGEKVRGRSILTPHKAEGKPCEASLREVAQCNCHPCERRPTVDCQFRDWGDWGACDKCGGQTRRFRHIATSAKHGGRQCDLTATEETKDCPVTCGDQGHCTWQHWGKWGACTAKCGHGRRMRLRYLTVSLKDDDEVPVARSDLQQMYMELKERNDMLEGRNSKELLVAFTFGLGVFGLAILGFRVLVAYRSSTPHRAGSAEYAPMDQVDTARSSSSVQVTEMTSQLKL